MTTLAISVGIADVRRDPDATSELVTQALMNTPAVVGETSGDWLHVKLPDYEGWVRADELAEPAVRGYCKIGEHCATPLDLVAVVIATHVPLYVDTVGDDTLDTIFLSTTLPLLDTTQAERLQVALPGRCMAWIARHAVSIRRKQNAFPQASIELVLSYACAFLGVAYLWGGTSHQGIDCSAFVQLCYRMAGYALPRDADQQHDFLTQTVNREELKEGDLIFFGRESITHVALALNSTEYIHAEGQKYNCVIINSFDPADVHYDQRLAEMFWDSKRVVL